MKHKGLKFNIDNKENIKWRIKEGAKGIIKTASGFTFMLLPIPTYVKFIALPQVINGAVDLTHSARNNYIKDSIINVGNDDVVKQNFSSPNTVLTCMLAPKKQKAAMLFMQEINFLLQANKTRNVNGKEERIKYSTNSQKMTKTALELMEKKGYISNLEIESSKKKRLFFEKIAMGNITGITKKEDMYNMSFNITDKKIDEKAIKKLIRKSLDSKELIVKKDKNGNIQSVNYRLLDIIKGKVDRLVKRFINDDKKLLPSESSKFSPDLNTDTNKYKQELHEMVKDENNSIMENTIIHENGEKMLNNSNSERLQ